MQLFYTPNITLPDYILPEQESAHCVRVLRLSEGEELHLTDGRGNMYRAVITKADPKGCYVRVVETQSGFEKLPYGVTVAVCPTKNIDRFEWFLEKATEVGVTRMIPLLCERSERRIVKRDRCMKVVTSALKQSLKAYHPEVDEATDFMKLIEMPFEGGRYIAHCEHDMPRKYLGDCVERGSNSLILIGPEGDFSPREIEAARAHGFVEVSLGQSRLRTETAAVAAVMMLSFLNH